MPSSSSESLALLQTWLLLAAMLFGFVAMARGSHQALVFPLLSAWALLLYPNKAGIIISEATHELGPVLLLFTAVAVTAHLVTESGALDYAAMALGARIGKAGGRWPVLQLPLLVFSLLLLTYVGAALLHNITSILIMVPVIIRICAIYAINSRWLLCAALVASNLGGFSTSWGDTPNIIESRIWGLTNIDFLSDVAPLNLIVLLSIAAVTTWLTRRSSPQPDAHEQAFATAGLAQETLALRERLDTRLLAIGASSLLLFILLQAIWREFELAAAAAALLAAVLAVPPVRRLQALQSLDLHLYWTLASIFIIAEAVQESMLGGWLMAAVESTGGSLLPIAVAAYFGTLSTEAASYAAATAQLTYDVNSSHAAAYALGAGICAGSSALLTAASAGLILFAESARFKGHAVSFAAYLPFGLLVSLGMLVFYVIALS